MPADNLPVAHHLYEALRSQDPAAVLATLSPDFRGTASEGMPNDLGGTYEGPESMLRDCWGRVFALADVRALPDEYLPVAPDRIVVIGRYVGTARDTNRPFSAAFAHLLRFANDGLITELVQITDTALWRTALER